MTEDEDRGNREELGRLYGTIDYNERKIEKAEAEAYYDGKFGLGTLGFSAIAGGVIGLLKGVAGMTIDDAIILGLIPACVSSGLFGIYTWLKAIGHKLNIRNMKKLIADSEKKIAKLNNPTPDEKD